ncbi:hypothetical protein Q9189_002816 [Teloschistes chrysophthalmus]
MTSITTISSSLIIGVTGRNQPKHAACMWNLEAAVDVSCFMAMWYLAMPAIVARQAVLKRAIATTPVTMDVTRAAQTFERSKKSDE